jgi:hypothetical protein
VTVLCLYIKILSKLYICIYLCLHYSILQGKSVDNYFYLNVIYLLFFAACGGMESP